MIYKPWQQAGKKKKKTLVTFIMRSGSRWIVNLDFRLSLGDITHRFTGAEAEELQLER